MQGRPKDAKGKSNKLFNKTAALLTMKSGTQAAAQHWCGLYCFAAGLRRPIFSALQELFTFVHAAEFENSLAFFPPLGIIDEIVCGVALLPLLYTDLRAPGGVSEVTHFIPV